MNMTTFVERGRTLLSEHHTLRRSADRSPELGLDLMQTQRVILDAVADLPIELTKDTRSASVTGVLHGSGPSPKTGPVVLLRGDMHVYGPKTGWALRDPRQAPHGGLPLAEDDSQRSRPHQALDAVPVLAHIFLAIQSFDDAYLGDQAAELAQIAFDRTAPEA